ERKQYTMQTHTVRGTATSVRSENGYTSAADKSTHTPGPWKAIVNNGRGSEWLIRHQEKTHVGGSFCTVEALHSTAEAIATCEANAKLIAAAPETAAERDELREKLNEVLQSDYVANLEARFSEVSDQRDE